MGWKLLLETIGRDLFRREMVKTPECGSPMSEPDRAFLADPKPAEPEPKRV
jgi:hypothetical protein